MKVLYSASPFMQRIKNKFRKKWPSQHDGHFTGGDGGIRTHVRILPPVPGRKWVCEKGKPASQVWLAGKTMWCRNKLLNYAFHLCPQFWQTAYVIVSLTVLVWCPNSENNNLGSVRNSHSRGSNHHPIISQYSIPFFRFCLTSLTACTETFSLPHLGHFMNFSPQYFTICSYNTIAV